MFPQLHDLTNFLSKQESRDIVVSEQAVVQHRYDTLTPWDLPIIALPSHSSIKTLRKINRPLSALSL